MKSKLLLTVLVGASCCSPGFAKKKDTNPADYPLSAKVISFEEHGGASTAPVMNSKTGAITGSVTTYHNYDREEFQINGVIYITSVLGGCRDCQKNLVLGKIYHAQMGPVRFRWHKYDAIQYLQLPTKGTELKVVTLQIIGKRLPGSQ